MKTLEVFVPPSSIAMKGFDIEFNSLRKTRKGEAFIEDLLASTSPEYIQSIREARAEYKAGKTKSHKEVFGE